MVVVTNEKTELVEGQYDWFLYRLLRVAGVILLLAASLFLYIGLPSHKFSVELWGVVIVLLSMSAATLLFRKNLTVTKKNLYEKSGFLGFSQKCIRHEISDFSSILITTHCILTSQNHVGPSATAIFVYLLPKGGGANLGLQEYAAGLGVDLKVFKNKVKLANSISKITGLRVDYSPSVRKSFGDFINNSKGVL